jgi:hypothetical protein
MSRCTANAAAPGAPLPATRPRRRPRAFALAVVTIATAACGSAAPPRERAATGRPAPGRTFTSKRYAFQVDLRGRWSAADAQFGWNGRQLRGLDSPEFANFNNEPTGRTLVVGASRVPGALGLTGWQAAMMRAAPSACSRSTAIARTTLGGEPALAWAARCADGYNVAKLAAVHGTRGYIVLLASPFADGAAQNHRVFESIRRGFRFTRR